MNVNALSNISDPYLQSLITNSVTGTNSPAGTSSVAVGPAGSPQLSPFAKVLSTLQQLQQTDPAKYQQVTSQIATNLQNAAKTATANGNTTQAAELNQLADDFTSASQNNTLPNVQDLAQAISGAHGHHHHRHMHADASSGAGQDPNSSAETSSSSTSQAISAFLVNGASSVQNSSLDPASIIMNTVNSAGL